MKSRRAIGIGVAVRLAGGLAASCPLWGCGGSAAAPAEQPPDADATGGAEDATPEAYERGLVAYGRGDLDGAVEALAEALRSAEDDPDVRSLAARVAAALGRDATALALLEGRSEVELAQIAARLQVRAQHLVMLAERITPLVEGAAELDPVLAAYLDVARAGAVHALNRVGGEPSTLPWVEGVPLPVVEIAVGDTPLLALVATSADLFVLDGETAARLTAVDPGGERGGVVRALRVGGATVERVPYFTRDLAPIAAQLGSPVAAVIGLDLLTLLRATLDGPARELVVRPGAGTFDDPAGEGVPYATFGGSHLAVRTRLAPRVGGFMLIDSAGLFPLAVVPDAEAALGVDRETLPPAPGAPSPDVRMFALPEVALGDVLLEDVPVVTGLVPNDLGQALGAPLAGIVGAAVLERFAVTFDPEHRRLLVR